MFNCVAVHVDDLMMAMINSQGIVDKLKKQYNFTFKGSGPIIEFHLGINFSKDEYGFFMISANEHLNLVFA